MNYLITMQDVKVKVGLEKYNTSLNHDTYLSYIQAYARHGWGLAGIIQMGDESYHKIHDDEDRYVWPSIKLIFQSPAKEGSPGGLL